MNARIKKTGEILQIASYAKITMDACDSWGNPLKFNPEEVELITEVTEDEHWQDVRERAAIAAMQAILGNTRNQVTSEMLNVMPKNAVIIADKLVEQLKKK